MDVSPKHKFMLYANVSGTLKVSKHVHIEGDTFGLFFINEP